eukprot:6200142-Pleurochrysis_carterae.AAC.1
MRSDGKLEAELGRVRSEAACLRTLDFACALMTSRAGGWGVAVANGWTWASACARRRARIPDERRAWRSA